MPTYLIELYLPSAGSPDGAVETARRVERAADGLRYVRTMFVAEDETCFHVFEAASRGAVAEAASRAGLTDLRVTEAIESDNAPDTSRSERSER